MITEKAWMITEKAAADIIKQTKLKPSRRGCAKDLSEKLSEIAGTFLVERLFQNEPSPSARVKRLTTIHAAAKRLLRTLPKDGGSVSVRIRQLLNGAAFLNRPPDGYPDFPPKQDGGYTDYRAREKVESVMHGVALLATWSATAIKREGWKKGRKKGHQEDEAMRHLFGNLNGVWLDYWDRLPGASIDSNFGEVGGPYIRFVGAFLSTLAKSLDDDDLQADPKLKQDLDLSHSAIRAHVRKTGIAKFRRMAESI